MKINIRGLISRLDSLRERLDDLLDNLDVLKEFEQEDIKIENVQQYFQADDIFHLAIAIDVLEQDEKLEDIEQELGIDLVILYKLLKSKKVFSFSNCGVWEVDNDGINLYEKTISIWNGTCKSEYPLSEYGKSFALTKEELL